MIHTETQNIEEEFIAFIQCWFDLLAQDKGELACAKIDSENEYGITWTAEKIYKLIKDEFGPETIFGKQHAEGARFSMVHDTKGTYRADVIQFTDKSGYWAEHDVPLNGEWSDLTAQFEFVGEGSEYMVILHDIHVL